MSYAVNTRLQKTSRPLAQSVKYPLITFAVVGTLVSVVTGNMVFYIPVGMICALGALANFISEALSHTD